MALANFAQISCGIESIEENAQRVLHQVNQNGINIESGGYARDLHATAGEMTGLNGERTAIITINVHGSYLEGEFYDTILGQRYCVTPNIFWHGLPEPQGQNIVNPWRGIRHLLINHLKIMGCLTVGIQLLLFLLNVTVWLLFHYFIFY